MRSRDEIEYEEYCRAEENEAHQRAMDDEWAAWAQAQEAADASAEEIRQRRRSLGLPAYVPARWLLAHPEAPIRWRLLAYDRSEMLGDIADF